MMIWRFFLRDFRTSSWRTLLLALTVAVAALSAVGFLASRMERLLGSEANALLAADAILAADHPIPAPAFSLAQPLQTAQTVTFPSMASAKGNVILASVKAVSRAYPLRGQLLLAPDSRPARAPQPGQVYLDARLAQTLSVGPGDFIGLGQLQLKVAAVLAREPDAGFDFSSLQPRLMMHVDDLPASGLLGFGSRVRYRLLVAGPDSAVRDWLEAMKPRLGRGERLENARENRPELNTALVRAERFLRLTALLTGVLSAAAILLAARRHIARHLDTVAILRTLGVSRQRLRGLLLGELFLLGLLAAVLGGLLGWAAEAGLIASVRSQLPANLPWPDWRAWPVAGGLGLGLLLASAGPLLLSLADTPPMRVLRHDLAPPPRVWLQWGVLFLVLAALFFVMARDAKLALWLGSGLLATLLLSGGAGLACLLLLRRFFASGALGLALRQLLARRGLAVAQLSALALGLLGLWLITVVETDLLRAWQSRLPVDAPNQFALNIQPEQLPVFRRQFSEQGLAEPVVQPMIRARWQMQNGRTVDSSVYQDERARRLAEREFNLSWQVPARADNRIVSGRVLRDDEAGFSVEEGIAKTLGIKVGDVLIFDVAGTQVKAPVINIRAVSWDSFQVNFFIVASRSLLRDLPASMITSFYLPPGQSRFVPDLVRALPNVTVVDVGAVLAEVRRVLDLSAAALRLVFGFCIVAGLTVLLAALDVTEAERRREAALLRALGATAGRLRRIWLIEGLLIGAVAGFLAGMLASGTAWALGSQVLDLPIRFNGWLVLLSTLTGCILTALAVWRRLARLAGSSPMQLLREEN